MNFFGVKLFATSSTLKVRKSHKKSACLDAYVRVYKRIRDGGGKSAPPGLIGLKVFRAPAPKNGVWPESHWVTGGQHIG